MKNMTLHSGAVDYLSRYKMFNGAFASKIMAAMPVPEGTPKRVKVIVRPIAYLKMVRLIMDFTTEVGWHGLCHRDENDPMTYIIEDVIVYPQNVTGTNITTDEVRQTVWLDQFPDEQFAQIRFHGHSHVNMGVFSSGTDDDLQRDIVDMMTKPEDFYLFFIMNKRLEIFVRLYDNKYGVMFETSDVDISIADEENNLNEFLRESRAQVKAVTYNYNKSTVANPTVANKSPIYPSALTIANTTKNTAPPSPNEGETTVVGYDDFDDQPVGFWDNGQYVRCSDWRCS